MKISIVIPVVQTELVKKLISQLAQGIVKPDKIVIIDVSEHGLLLPEYPRLDIDIIRVVPNYNLSYYMPALGTNEAWTMGYNLLKQYIPYYGVIGFLNDDIEINPYFLQSIYLTFNTHKNISFLYPQTVNTPERVQEAKLSYSDLIRTKSRMGYAWFIKRSVFDQIPPFPEQCKIWYGDNWVICHLAKLGHKLFINRGNFIYHHGGTTSKQLKLSLVAHNLHLSKRRREEHKSYLRAIRQWKKEHENE